MHVLDVICLCWTIHIVRGKYVGNDCFEKYGYFAENVVIKPEYENLNVDFKRFIKQECKKGKLTMIWFKGRTEIMRRVYKKTGIGGRLELKFYSLSKSNTGNYTLQMYNDVIRYNFYLSLTVTDGSPLLRALRENMVPKDAGELNDDRLYWMPKMIDNMATSVYSAYENNSLSCYYFSTRNITHHSVRWYHRPGSISRHFTKGDYGYDIKSKTKTTSILGYDCDRDEWMPSHEGFCFSADLYFTPFLKGDGGLYSCKVNDYLVASMAVTERFTAMDIVRGEDRWHRDALRKSLTFNGSTTVCAESWFVLRCFSEATNIDISLWFINKSRKRVLLASSNVSLILYKRQKAQHDDTGQYFCGTPRWPDKQMNLTVSTCSQKTLYLVTALTAIMLIVVVVVSLISHRCVKIQRRRALHQKIQSLSKAKGMFRNQRYIPLESDLSWEINRDNISISSELLGSGEFGNVFKGTFGPNEVAMKVAKPEGLEMLSREIEIMKQLGNHRNVIQLLGVCSTNGAVVAILELASGGNLRQHLRDHNPLLKPLCEQIGLEQLLTFVTEIARGMEYLARKQVIHGDLAARNCLISSDMSIKLSDFGMTRVALNYSLGDAQGAMAVAWMAPETVSANTVTSKSDVWSFGIVMWEVFELGACPYPSMTSAEIIEAVSQSIVNSQPSIASDAVYAIMQRCWIMEPNDRPTFAELKVQLDEVDVNEYL